MKFDKQISISHEFLILEDNIARQISSNIIVNGACMPILQLGLILQETFLKYSETLQHPIIIHEF